MSSPLSSPDPGGNDEDCSFERVNQVSQNIAELIAGLRPHAAELGADGPELFGYIENGERQITEQLDALAARGAEVTAHALYDKNLRHDFRNLIGSVTGFAELILMESGIEPRLAMALTKIRQYSSEFVRLLDAQKAAAATV